MADSGSEKWGYIRSAMGKKTKASSRATTTKQWNSSMATPF